MAFLKLKKDEKKEDITYIVGSIVLENQ